MKDNIPLHYILKGRVTHRLGWNREDQTFSPHYLVLSTPPTHYNRSTFHTSISRHANTSFALLRSDMQHWHPKLAHNHLIHPSTLYLIKFRLDRLEPETGNCRGALRPVHGAPAVGLSPAVQNDSRRNDVIAKKALHEHNARANFVTGCRADCFSREPARAGASPRSLPYDVIPWSTLIGWRFCQPGRAGEKTPWTGLCTTTNKSNFTRLKNEDVGTSAAPGCLPRLRMGVGGKDA